MAFPEAEARILLDFDGGSEEEVERDVTRSGEILLECGALDVALATDEAKRRTLWDVRRGIADAIHDLGVSVELDLAVPRSELVALVEGVRRIASAAALHPFCYGHAADGNLHVRLLCEGLEEAGSKVFDEAVSHDLRRGRPPRRDHHRRARRRRRPHANCFRSAATPPSSPPCAQSSGPSIRTGS